MGVRTRDVLLLLSAAACAGSVLRLATGPVPSLSPRETTALAGILATLGDRDRPLDLLRQASLEGDPEAAYRLARDLARTAPQPTRVHPDPDREEEIRTWLELASERGHGKAPGELCTRIFFSAVAGGRDGDSVEGALRWCRLGAERDDPAAMCLVAVSHQVGIGVEASSEAAAAWYRRAADLGYPPAMYYYSLALEAGTGVAADPTAAMMWCRRAAGRGFPEAETRLGKALEDGDGVPVDAARAASWYASAAKKGHAPAMLALARLYREGRGVPQDPAQALHWETSAGAVEGSSR